MSVHYFFFIISTIGYILPHFDWNLMNFSIFFVLSSVKSRKQSCETGMEISSNRGGGTVSIWESSGFGLQGANLKLYEQLFSCSNGASCWNCSLCIWDILHYWSEYFSTGSISVPFTGLFICCKSNHPFMCLGFCFLIKKAKYWNIFKASFSISQGLPLWCGNIVTASIRLVVC